MSEQTHTLVARQYTLLNQQILPGLASEGIHFLRRATWDDVRAAAPDVVVFMPCGYERDQAVTESATLPWDGPLWATDSTHLFSRCTPQAVAGGLDVLAAILHGGTPDPTKAVRIK